MYRSHTVVSKVKSRKLQTTEHITNGKQNMYIRTPLVRSVEKLRVIENNIKIQENVL
jgi:hypothetical protein